MFTHYFKTRLTTIFSNMKIPNYIKGLALMIALTLGYSVDVSAQCAPTFSGPKCVGAPITFFHNSPGSSGWQWDFGDGKTSVNSSPTHSFTAPGTYKVCITLTTGANKPCNACVDVVIVPNPVVNAVLLTEDTQCFNGNNFYYLDTSSPAPGSKIVRESWSWSDGEVQTFNNPTHPFNVTKKFQDPAGGTYDLTVEIEDANGCITIKKYPSSITVRASLGLDFFIPSDEKCDSVLADVTNTSKIDISEIKSFEWDFGDYKNTTDWKPAPDHWYYTQGPNNGWWDVKLSVESTYGCKDTFEAKNAVRNLLLDVRIVADKDSTCLSEPEICFDIINLVRNSSGGFDTFKTIPGITGFLWNYGHPNPPTPDRFNNQSLASCHSYGMGPWEASFTYYHPICGDRTVFDTILVIGPTAAIEAPPMGIVIAQHHRYQCVARDTVQFTNASTFYHNDVNMWDDDSTYANHNPLGHYFDAAQHSIPKGTNIRNNEHVQRLWDFGDQYAPQCTTDTKRGINVGMNCNFSRDSLPKHWYTDWEDIYRDSFYARNAPFDQIRFNDITGKCFNERLDTTKPAAHREYFWKNIPTVFNARLVLKDTLHPLACEHSSSAIITLLGASAKNLRFSGVYCLGGASPQYGVNFHLDDTKPGATSNYAYINFDVNLDPDAWVKLHDTTNGSVQTGTRPGGPPVLMPYGMNGAYGTTYSTAYTPAMIADRKSGCVKIGLIIGTGVTYNPGKYPECVDTQYYEDAVCFPVIDPSFDILEPHFRANADTDPLKTCKGDEIVVRLTKDNLTNTDVVNFLEWRLTTNVAGPNTDLTYNQRIFESYLRNQTDPTDPTRLRDLLFTTRFTKPLQSQSQNIQDVVISDDTIVVGYVTEWDTAINFDPIWDAVDQALTDAGFDIFELTPSQIRRMLGEGTCGLDTTGFGPILKELEYINPIKRQTVHFRDTSILPFEQRMINGVLENVVVFKPEHNGKYNLSLAIDGGPGHCVSGNSKVVSVGFYSNIWYNDSIVCHQDLGGLKAKATFLYYNVNPLIPDVLDRAPYWDPKLNPGRKYGDDKVSGTKEDFVKWDWSSDDDDQGNPQTIFGGFPYSSTGYDTIVLGGGIAGSLYYKDWGLYEMRITTGDSTRSPNQCRDTIRKNLYVTDVQAGFALSSDRPQCTNIVEIFDTSRMFDPCVAANGRSCDNIINYYIDFGDGKGFTQWPADVWRKTKIGWNYTSNGDYVITLIVETERGCFDTAYQNLFIPGPQPNFETISSREICVNEDVAFANRSKDPSTSATWTWDFGDGKVESGNFTEYNGGKDTIYHTYGTPGVYQVYLTQFDSIPGTSKFCPATYPDTTLGKQIPITILVNPIDSVVLFANGNRDSIYVCPGELVDFNVEADKNTYSSFVFEFGDGDSTTTSDTITSHAYANAGRYVATIQPIVDPLLPRKACPMVDTVIIIVQDVVADFDIDSTDKPNFCFINKSEGGTSYRWGYYHKEDIVPDGKTLLEDADVNNKDKVCNNYRDSLGKWYVCLEASNELGCTDTICKEIEYTYFFLITPYNVFTPGPNSLGDGDGMNDEFVIDITGHTKYSITIVNRWGQNVFKSEDSNVSWNGKVNNTGAVAPDGTYYWVITYENEEDDEEHTINGVVTLIREKN